MGRISKDEYYYNIAKAVSLRSTCLRRQYGAVIVNNDEIISTGYNGSPPGEINCCDKGECRKNLLNIPHWEGYEECCATHAEMNAITSASRERMIGGYIYLYGYDLENKQEIEEPYPCAICLRLIKRAGLMVRKWKGYLWD